MPPRRRNAAAVPAAGRRLGTLARHLGQQPAAGQQQQPRAAQHHNGAPVEPPRDDDGGGPAQPPPRDPAAAAAHNLSLAPHASTPLMAEPFDWAAHGSPRRDSLRAVTPAMAEQFDRDGFVVVEGAFAGDELAALVAEVDRLEAELQHSGGISSADQITFCAHLVLKSDICRAFTGRAFTGSRRSLVVSSSFLTDCFWFQTRSSLPSATICCERRMRACIGTKACTSACALPPLARLSRVWLTAPVRLHTQEAGP